MATVTSHELLIFLIQVAVLLLTAAILGILTARLAMPAVVAELLTGVLLGPSLMGHAAPTVESQLFPAQPGQARLLDVVGQFGVLLLVGMTGAHLDKGFARRSAGAVGRVSATCLVIPFGLGLGTGLLLPHALMGSGANRTRFALLMGVALAVSALPVIAKTLADMNLLHRDTSQLILAAGTVDDTVAWLGLAIVAAGLTMTKLAASAAALAGFLVIAVVGVRPVVRLVMRQAERWNEPAVPAVAVVIILLGAAATNALGLEAAFGAFVFGALLFSDDSSRFRLGALRSTVQSVLAPIFLASAGLRMDLTALTRPAVLGAALVALLVAIIGKFSGAYLGARLARLSHWEGIALGAGLNARGVVQVVVATIGLRLGLLNTASYTVLLLIAIATSIMAPPLLRISMARIPKSTCEHAREEFLAAPPPPSAQATAR